MSFINYLGFGLLLVLILAQLVLIVSRLRLRKARAQKKQAQFQLVKAKINLAQEKRAHFEVLIDYELVKGKNQRKAEKSRLN